jgi:hypothetical protein
MAMILCTAAVKMEVEATLKVSRHIVRGMALISFIVAVEKAEATLEVSGHIIREIALILCIVAVDTMAEATLNVSRHIVRQMALILCIVAVDMEAKEALKVLGTLSDRCLQFFSVFVLNITTLQAQTAVTTLPLR